MLRILLCALPAAALSTAALAADLAELEVPPSEEIILDRAFTSSFGARYWFSTGETQNRLYDTTGEVLVSRLTWDDFHGHSGEVFGQINLHRLFLKGHAGGGVVI